MNQSSFTENYPQEFKAPPNKPTGFQFDVRQWLGDQIVMSMNLAEQGMHMRLMCIAWQETPPCTLPDDDIQLSQWLNIPLGAWSKIHKAKVMRAWKTIPNNEPGAGRWVLEGLQRSYLHQVKVLSTRSMAAQTRWQKERENCITQTDNTPIPIEDKKAYIWRMGIELLTPEYTQQKARQLIGKWIKDYGEVNVAHILAELSLKAQTVADRYTFITAALVARGKKTTQRKAAGSGDFVI